MSENEEWPKLTPNSWKNIKHTVSLHNHHVSIMAIIWLICQQPFCLDRCFRSGYYNIYLYNNSISNPSQEATSMLQTTSLGIKLEYKKTTKTYQQNSHPKINQSRNQNIIQQPFFLHDYAFFHNKIIPLNYFIHYNISKVLFHCSKFLIRTFYTDYKIKAS